MNKSPDTLTTQESYALLDRLRVLTGTIKQKKRGLRNFTIALLMLEAGLRVGEVVKLKWNDLFWNYKPVTSIIIRAEIAKTKTERQIPISERLREALKNHHGCFSLPDRPADTYFVFYSQYAEESLTTRQVERFIWTASVKAFGRPIHPHILRHTFASRLMRITSMPVVQELLGHKALSSTQIYTHPNGDDLKAAIDGL